MRKLALVLAVAALVGMTQGNSQANEYKHSGAEGSTSSGSDSSYGRSGAGGSTETKSKDMEKSSTTEESSATGGATDADTAKLINGWSAKKMIMNKPIYNEKNEKVGSVEDIIINQEDAVSYAIIGVGGFVGIGEKYVAVPFHQLKMTDNKFVMSGATKEELKQKPKFEYKKQKK